MTYRPSHKNVESDQKQGKEQQNQHWMLLNRGALVMIHALQAEETTDQQ